MTDTPKRLAFGQLTASGATYYTVPSATTTIVRHMRLANTSSSSSINVTVGINGTTGANIIVPTFAVPANSVYDWTGFLVLNATDTLQAFASSASNVNIVASGVEVS